jgi:hypothetical protein
MSGILNTNHLDQSIETTFEQRVAAADPKYSVNPNVKYDVSNPHPGYGKDPNILNEFGHTKYPKWVKTKDGTSEVAKDAKHEAELTGEEVSNEPVKVAKGWTE